jgi:tetratricopeptide (TPR) repeat protein
MNVVGRALDIFSDAVDLADAERESYLDNACGADAELRSQVDKMLCADAQTGQFLAQPIVPKRFDRSGERLGTYRLDALIGSGGMGSVYRARRADGAFDKPVAIKLLMFDAGDLRTRFALEQRILGNLSHTHIATLLDVGNDANGAPYFVMEYIDGVSITEYVRTHPLDLRAKIELFLPILDAVQSAHSQLIVHRDIKPGNVLVDGHGVVKLLDFGIAKLLGESVAATRTGLGPLTPEYASPEQVRGDPVGTPSDIYSLGILLYELTTGARPYQIGDVSPSGIERTVCEAEPPRPSTRFITGSGGGSARDLDAILLKALAKAPTQRYASCAEFSADLNRWCSGETVIAREPTTRERLGRYVRRHKLGVSVAAAASLALLIGLAVAVWQAKVAREQARIASVERDRTQRVNKFLTDTLGAANPADMGRKATVTDLLARARKLADKELANDPATAAVTQQVLSDTYRALGDFSAARDCAVLALEAAKRSDDPSLKIDANHALASAQYALGDGKSAVRFATVAREQAVATGTAIQRGDTATLLGQIADENGDAAAAFAWYDVAIAELPADDYTDRATVINNYGHAKHQQGDDAGSLLKYREAIALLANAHLDGDAASVSIYGNLAAALRGAGKLDEAVDILIGQVLPKQIELLGENSPDVVWTLSNLSSLEYERNDQDAMRKYALQGYQAAEHRPDENEWKPIAIKKYGLSLMRSGRAVDAVPILERAVALSKADLPPEHFSISSAESALGLARSMAGDRAGGEALAQQAYERLLAKFGAKYEVTITAKKNLDKIQSLTAK